MLLQAEAWHPVLSLLRLCIVPRDSSTGNGKIRRFSRPGKFGRASRHCGIYNSLMDFKGKVALVTGAGKRIGKAISLELARAGADIALHYHTSAEQAVDAAREIAELGRRVETFSADLTQPEQIAAMFAAVKETLGRLDVLVNNAGVYHRTPIESLTAKQWDAEFAVNARAAALCIRYAVPLMSEGGGAIVNIADIAAEKTWPSYPAYCASKAALLALTKSAAKALAPNIRVNAVSPGAALWADDMGEDEKQAVLAQVPMKRPGSPEDVAKAVVFLAGQDYITAQNLRVDGGWHMG